MPRPANLSYDHGVRRDRRQRYPRVADGSQVDVHLDRDFNVLGTPADHENYVGEDSPDDGE